MIEAKLFSEIFEEFSNAETKQDRIAVLKKYRHPRLVDFLEYAFNRNILFDVPIPATYRPAPEPAGLNITYLDLEVPKMYRFIVGHPKRVSDIPPEKQTKILTSVLEALHPDEAELLIKCIKKDLGIKFLTTKLIQEAYN
jgi:hypothetical protein